MSLFRHLGIFGSWHHGDGPTPKRVIQLWKARRSVTLDPPPGGGAGGGTPNGRDPEWSDHLNQLIREEIRHEDALVNSRLLGLLTSQAFLFAGLAELLSADREGVFNRLLEIMVPALGVVLSLLTLRGIQAAQHTQVLYRELVDELKEEDSRFNLVGRRLREKREGDLFSVNQVRWFIWFWGVVGVLLLVRNWSGFGRFLFDCWANFTEYSANRLPK